MTDRDDLPVFVSPELGEGETAGTCTEYLSCAASAIPTTIEGKIAIATAALIFIPNIAPLSFSGYRAMTPATKAGANSTQAS